MTQSTQSLNEIPKIASIFEIQNITSKKWCQVAIAVGILVVIGAVGFGIIGLLHSYGVIHAPSWLAPAIEIVGATPHFWSLWIIATGSVVLGGGFFGLVLYGYLKGATPKDLSENENATSLPTTDNSNKNPLGFVANQPPSHLNSKVAQPTNNPDLPKLWDNYLQALEQEDPSPQEAQDCKDKIKPFVESDKLTADQTVSIWKRIITPNSKHFNTPDKINTFNKMLLPMMDHTAKDKEGNTVLHDLCNHALLSDVIVYFFKFYQPEVFNTCNSRHETPFHIAFNNPQCNHIALGELASLSVKSQLMQKDQDDFTPVYYAVKRCVTSTPDKKMASIYILEKMIPKQATVDNVQHSRALLESVLEHSDLDTCERLLVIALPILISGINVPSSKGLTPLKQIEQDDRFATRPKIRTLLTSHGAVL